MRGKRSLTGPGPRRGTTTMHAHSAWVWGSSVKHHPQKVGIDHVLEDEDVVQIVKK